MINWFFINENGNVETTEGNIHSLCYRGIFSENMTQLLITNFSIDDMMDLTDFIYRVFPLFETGLPFSVEDFENVYFTTERKIKKAIKREQFFKIIENKFHRRVTGEALRVGIF